MFRSTLRQWTLAAALALACGLLAPAAFAGGHGGHRGHGNAYGHSHRGSVHHTYRTTVIRSSRHAPVRYYSRPVYGYAGYRGHGYARYNHYRPHHHWRVGEVLGAVVAGAVITNLISDALQPRTTVVERTVIRDDPYRRTVYRGSNDDGYYGNH